MFWKSSFGRWLVCKLDTAEHIFKYVVLMPCWPHETCHQGPLWVVGMCRIWSLFSGCQIAEIPCIGVTQQQCILYQHIISETMLSNAFSFMPSPNFYSNMSILAQVMIWCPPGDSQYPNQNDIFCWCIYASLGLDELTHFLQSNRITVTSNDSWNNYKTTHIIQKIYHKNHRSLNWQLGKFIKLGEISHLKAWVMMTIHIQALKRPHDNYTAYISFLNHQKTTFQESRRLRHVNFLSIVGSVVSCSFTLDDALICFLGFTAAMIAIYVIVRRASALRDTGKLTFTINPVGMSISY